MAQISAGEPQSASRPPFERYGWVLWGAWMVFLVFPAADIVTEHTRPQIVYGLLVLAVFVVGFTRGTHLVAVRPRAFARPGVLLGYLAWLLVPTVALVPILDFGVLSVWPFLISFGTFALPRPAAWVFSGGLVAASAALSSLPAGRDELPMVFVLIAVALATGAGRVMRDHSEEYRRRHDEEQVSQERDRVARDVHDVLGHSLTVLVVKAEVAGRLVDLDPERARAEMADIEQLGREALAEIRATVGGLRTAGLAQEIEAARAALGDAGIEVTMPADVQVLDPRHRPVAGWVLREAITNVIRHSGATGCAVALDEHALLVTDDGVGVNGNRPGNGLRGLAERARETGGVLEVGPGPQGRGTRLEVSW